MNFRHRSSPLPVPPITAILVAALADANEAQRWAIAAAVLARRAVAATEGGR